MKYLIFVISIFISGCTIYDRYELDSDEVKLNAGKIQVVFEGNYNEEKLTWGNPYSIQIWITQSKEYGLSEFTVKEAELIEVGSGVVVELGESKSGWIRSNNQNDWSVAGYSPPSVPYTSYLLKAKIVICSKNTENCEIKTIEMPINLKKSKERHLNKFDELMSV